MECNLITVITITFNNIDGLLATANSVNDQKTDKIEWVVIDGGSNDGTSKFLDECDFVARYISERDNGIYDAMQKGLHLAGGNRIVFLNAGDVFADSDAGEYIISHHTDADVCFYACRVSGLGVDYIRKPRPLSSASYSVPAVQQATVYKRDVLLSIEWPTQYRVCGDFALAAQLLARNATYYCDNRVVAQFELGGVSTLRPLALGLEAYNIQTQILELPLSLKILHFSRRLLTGYFVLASYRLRALFH
ncbi:glycosyltransferase [Sinimarinibacterium sp. CAU 1509]|uniref:glycosyltransferase n=1 Tax=Sinimarinibacterium sp. CAU 1509 TaxID=2562283 RepID=UPI0010AB589A|nr:glycosyltransferase [Sinimarinibacterium sp. CAU 1509]TJY61957.1 glycosyltransferase [Sinimarinibacterium sp. CAU 1509]